MVEVERSRHAAASKFDNLDLVDIRHNETVDRMRVRGLVNLTSDESTIREHYRRLVKLYSTRHHRSKSFTEAAKFGR